MHTQVALGWLGSDQVLYLVHTQVALGWLGSVPGAVFGAYPGSTMMAWQCSRYCTWCIPR